MSKYGIYTAYNGMRPSAGLKICGIPISMGYQILILDTIDGIDLVSRRDTKKIEMLAKFAHRGEMFVKIIHYTNTEREREERGKVY
jgi:predicted peroxiredoxin